MNQGFRLALVNPGVKLQILTQGNFVKIEWAGTGLLTASTQITGPYTVVGGVQGSPAQIPLNVGQTRFFRVEQ